MKIAPTDGAILLLGGERGIPIYYQALNLQLIINYLQSILIQCLAPF